MRTFILGAPLADGTLFRSDPTTHLNHVKYPVRVPAGVGFSPTCDTLYFAEAGERVVYAYRFEGETGGVSHERVLIKFAEGNGVPWGVAVSEDGDLWVGVYGGGKVVRVDATSGTVKGVVSVPKSRLVVGVAFVGEGLLVTTARLELEGVLGEEEAGEDNGEHAGSLFHVPLPGVVGREIYKARFDKVPEDPGTTSGKVAVKDKDKKAVPPEFEHVLADWPAGVEMPKPEKETPKPEELAG
jgi:sugar lactone lactonase YvrE